MLITGASPTRSSYHLRQKRISCPRNNSAVSVVSPQKQVSFGALWDRLFPQNKTQVLSHIKDSELKKNPAFQQFEDFLKQNNLKLSFDESRKKYKANPCCFAVVDGVYSGSNSLHGWGNSKQEAIANMIEILSNGKERGWHFDSENQCKKLEIPQFATFDLFRINVFRQVEFQMQNRQKKK